MQQIFSIVSFPYILPSSLILSKLFIALLLMLLLFSASYFTTTVQQLWLIFHNLIFEKQSEETDICSYFSVWLNNHKNFTR